MSSSLGWEPTKQSKLKWLDCSLKFALQKRFGSPVSIVLTSDHNDYLRGLADAGVKDAQTLLDAIEKYDSIDVVETF